MSPPDEREIAAPSAGPAPFPRLFWVANGIEVLERAAFYGVYVNLQIYLLDYVKMSAREIGDLLGLFSLARAVLPVVVGAVADVIGFRRSLLCAFALYAMAYGALYAAPTRVLAYSALFGMAIGGAFMKPVISGSVKRYSPPGRQTEGFAIFYAAVNGGSVIGKILTFVVRSLASLRASMLNAIVASVLALVTAFLGYREDDPQVVETKAKSIAEEVASTLRTYGAAVRDVRLGVFLVVVAGYYLLIEQFYQTFPVYMVRVVSKTAPRELFTLINPISIAVLQVVIARLTRRIDPLLAMAIGIGLGSVSMLAMGIPTVLSTDASLTIRERVAEMVLSPAAGSFFLFALAEMIFSPRYYAFVGSFAPPGKEGLYMGLAVAPLGVGALVGGVLSGRLIERFLPADGAQNPLAVWGTYAAIGFVCALSMLAYRAIFRARAPVQAT